MLCKYVKGRLGNQLFQYATLRAFQMMEFKDQEITLSFQKVEKKAKKEHFKDINSLEHFKVKHDIGLFYLSLKQKGLILIISSILFVNKVLYKKDYPEKRNKIEKKFKTILLKNNIIWKTAGYEQFDLTLINKEKNILFYGYFESPKYFNTIKKQLQKEFTPKEKPLLKNKKLYQEIKNNNSICISIRRGDFVTNEKYKKEHFICDETYFKKAINKMNKKVKDPKYIVFSDDIQWVKDNMKFPKGTLYETGDDPVWEKLRLMYSCKHFIISNSSFSWWAQYLSRNKEKIVIAPKKWNLKNDNKDIYEDNFILI